MNRRNFLKSFSAAVVGTVAAIKLPLATPLAERVAEVKTHVKLVNDFIEIPIDRFNTMRITKLQYYMRLESFTNKGYVLSQDGKRLVYTPKYIEWDDEEWDSI
jgi:hypothetical protein